MKRALIFATIATQLCAQNAPQEPSGRITPNSFADIAKECAPELPASTLRAIATTESSLNTYALSLNYPHTVAVHNGHHSGVVILQRQPRTAKEAEKWADWFLTHHYSVSIGLMQINTQTAQQLHITAHSLFDPCTNVKTAATIIESYYHHTRTHTKDPSTALLNTISLYNSGDMQQGFNNGYVNAVVRNFHP